MKDKDQKNLEIIYEMAYPQSFSFDQFNKIPSYAGKLKYANTHLQRITSGSSRTVYKIDEEKALKIAKNKKGLDQNRIESDRSIHSYGVTAEVFETADDNFWLEMELAKKLSPKRFKELTGISLEELQGALRYLDVRRGKQKYGKHPNDNIYENDFYQDLERFIVDYDFPIGDFSRLNSYGEVIRDGNPKVVLIDFGLSNDVWNTHYKNFYNT